MPPELIDRIRSDMVAEGKFCPCGEYLDGGQGRRRFCSERCRDFWSGDGKEPVTDPTATK